jgi:hypothetical protein
MRGSVQAALVLGLLRSVREEELNVREKKRKERRKRKGRKRKEKIWEKFGQKNKRKFMKLVKNIF